MALLALAGCGKAPRPDLKVLAIVGDRVLRVEDLEKEIAWRQQARRPVPEAQVLLDEMVQQETLVQRARATGLENDGEFQRSYRGLLAARLKERDLNPRRETLQVSDDELQAAYEKQLDRYTQPAKARLALIQLKFTPKMSEAQLAELRTRTDEARREALDLGPAEPGFGKVAIAFSEDQASRYKGGDVGWFDEGPTHYRWPLEVITVGFALKNAGEISEVIQATNGFYLVKKLDTRPGSVTPRAQVEETLRRRLLAEKREQLEKSFLSDARQAARVQTFPDALAALPASVTATTVARRASDEPPSLP